MYDIQVKYNRRKHSYEMSFTKRISGKKYVVSKEVSVTILDQEGVGVVLTRIETEVDAQFKRLKESLETDNA